MVKAGACGFCGTAVEGLAAAHVEQAVDDRVRRAEAALRRDLESKLEDREPSAVVVAAAEAGRYTAAKVWGCGAGCLSTVGSLVMLVIIVLAGMAPQLIEQYQDWQSRQKAPASELPAPQPPAHKKPSPKKRPNKRR